ncbi:VWFA and cache domaincontaining protein 1like, partial [Caligus rogercresseyi]
PPSPSNMDSFNALSSLSHSIHHRASLLRRKEATSGELLTPDRSTLLSLQYPDPQFLGISVEPPGIPRSVSSSFIYSILSNLVPYKDFLLGSSPAAARCIEDPSLQSYSIPSYPALLTHPPERTSALNSSLLADIRRNIAPKRLRVHVFGYKPSPEGKKELTTIADHYTLIGEEDDIFSVESDFLYRRLASTSSVKILVPPLGKEVVLFAHLESDARVRGLSVPMDYLFSEVYAYNREDSSAYLFHKSGRLLYQPSNENVSQPPSFRSHVLQAMLRDRQGDITMDGTDFRWKRVDTTPFILLLAKYLLGTSNTRNQIFYLERSLGIIPANTDTGSLFLSGLAFKDPLHRPRPSDFMAFLNGESDHNPGIRVRIKEEVLLLSQITPFWKAKAFDSGLNNYIVRRYKQEWFLRASKFPGRVILSPPRLDPTGAGYIVTLSRTLYHTQTRVPSTVLAMDMTLGYIYKVLINTLPTCKASHTNRCFIFDHEGYVIVHPKVLKGLNIGKKYHLTQIEPQIINDLLTFGGFVRKKACLSRRDPGLVHKRYEFNQSYSSPVASALPRCNSYEISPIPESNLFLGVVNTSNCDEKGESAINFCPCNVEGDSCIICGSLELLECECPCTCRDPCMATGNDSLPSCDEEPQSVFQPSPVDLDYLSDLPECLTTECGRRTREEDCLGVLGCSWCREKLLYDTSNWVSMLSESFCGSLEECFDGRLGQEGPYQLIDRRNQEISSSLGAFEEFRSSPIGPVAGGIMGLFLFLSLSVYCYRIYINGSSPPVLNSSNSDQVTRRLFDHSSLRTLDDEEDKRRPPYACPNNVSSIEIPPNAILSPYRMNPEYRRPPPGTDSDHGYSTMTPFGDIDSDIAQFLLFKNLDPTEAQQHSLIESNDEAIYDESVTVLGANQFIVAATIHMVDTQ